jgi:hypothetical protein
MREDQTLAVRRIHGHPWRGLTQIKARIIAAVPLAVASRKPSLMSMPFVTVKGQTGRVPRTARTIQISKHAPINPAIR